MGAAGYRNLSNAQKLARRGRLEEAEEYFRKAVDETKSPAAKAHLAVLLADRGKFKEALELSQQAYEEDELLGAFRGRVLVAAGKFDDAVRMLRDFTRSSARNLLGWGYLAVALLATGRLKEAGEVLSQHPMAASAELRARLLLEAERILRDRGIEASPAELLLCSRKPRLLLRLRRQFQARACVSLGMKLLEQDEPEAAVGLLRAALLLHAEQPVAGFYLGLALLQTGKAEEAAEAFRKVPRGSRLYDESRGCLGAALYFAGKLHEAAEFLESECDDELSFYFRGLTRLALGQRGGAAEDFAEALKRDPSLATERLRRLRQILKDA